MSQSFDLGPTFDFMQSRKVLKNDKKLENLRHVSLDWNLKNTHRTFQIYNLYSN